MFCAVAAMVTKKTTHSSVVATPIAQHQPLLTAVGTVKVNII